MKNNHTSVLFSGCSFTKDCGFLEENIHLHWVSLFSEKYNLNKKNIAIGGSSNDEIFTRTLEYTNKQKPDLAIVMWSNISRRWEYFSDNNIDDFTILNSEFPEGRGHDKDITKQFAKLRITYFNNSYINIKKWFAYAISLACYFNENNIDYIFLRGFDNYIEELSKIFLSSEALLADKSDGLKHMYDFSNRPDDYIAKKIKEMQDLYNTVSKLNWANLNSDAFYQTMIDVADDQMHPGKLSNEHLYAILSNYYEEQFR